MNERMERFIALLNQIFEMDKSDLDFGIYRILKVRRDEIQKFFKEGLPKQIKETLAPFAQGNKDELRQKIAEIEKQAAEFGTSPENNPKYNELKAQLQQGTDLSALESDVYSALYNFFSRYYDEGDFISKRRYKEGVYAIPYEGEEVKLYWANQDQYYIKTSENFKDYTFKVGDYTVHFLLVDATTEQNNNKETDDKKRQFMLFTEDEEKYLGVKTFEFNEEEKTVNIRFIFDIPEDKKAKYYELNVAGIKQWLSTQPTNVMMELLRIANPDAKTKDQISIIEKHLKAYIAKNTFDYFIHKDLGGFLTRELDFFIKNEVMHLDDLDTENEAKVETYIAKVRAIKQVGRVIIKFLAQIENFQKKLWLKKKFVVETNWCITLDRIPEKYYDEIRQNKAQVQEWVDMYAINELETDLDHTEPFTEVPSILFLKQNQNLIVDTKNFAEEFKNRLIAEFDDLDKETGGLMINSDNFHGLRLLQTRYNGKVKCTYADPPYNAKSSKILYKNTFEHSSWLSLIENRVQQALPLLNEDSVTITAIDEVENEKLGMLLDYLYKPFFDGKYCISSVINPSGQQGKNFSTNHENLYFYFHDLPNMLSKENRDEENADVRNFMNGSVGESGDYKRETGKNCFYPIYVKNGSVVDIGEVCSDEEHYSHPNVRLVDGTIAVYPVDQYGVERKWLFERGTVDEIIEELSVQEGKDGTIGIIRTKTAINYKTVWNFKKHSAKTYGTGVLKDLFGKGTTFSFPKSLYAVQDCVNIGMNKCEDGICLDYFGGSGTTGHAVLSLNRVSGNRKYILIEMGAYFNTATHPRVKKAIFSNDWKKGVPTTRTTGISHIMKYLRLESYEDALSNIELKKNNGMAGLFGDDYMINYMLDIEAKGSLLNLKAFKSPFSYEMNITEKNESKPHKIDVCETFNYLIGLTVQRQGFIRTYDSTPAAKPEYEGAVDLVKGTQFAFRQIEGTLPDGRKALVIWRTIGDDLKAYNAALDAYFEKYRINPLDREYDVIYVNGDNNLENLRTANETWKVVLIEQEFNKRMFEEE